MYKITRFVFMTYLTSAYLAPIQYYSILMASSSVSIEKYDSYLKQTYRNRCNILAANGAMALSIPVEHSNSLKPLTKDICIADHGNWQHLHWNAIISAYNSTPFFEYYKDDFAPFYHKKYKFLYDLNEELRVLICELIGIDSTHISYTDAYEKEVEGDFRDIIHPKKDWRIVDPSFLSNPYYQVFGQKFGFTDNLSIIDLLFNMGNESLLVLQNSR